MAYHTHGSSTSPRLLWLMVGSALALIFIFTSYSSKSLRPWHRSSVEEMGPRGPIRQIRPLLPTRNSGEPTLDIVLSMYKEPLDQTARMIHELKGLEPFRNLSINTHLYVKDVDANARDILHGTGADNVTVLQNAGREAGSFLTHIVRNWDNLARHTLFVQAEMHDYDNARNRIADWFYDQTGFMSLGSYEKCECVRCTDGWDEDRVFARIPELYAALNGELCPREVTITYLGQFIVSATRLRSRSLDTYKYLQSILQSDEEHFIHADPRQDMFADDKSNPYFGHTMERAWNIMWNCSDTSLYKKCASAGAFGRRRASDQEPDECQCID